MVELVIAEVLTCKPYAAIWSRLIGSVTLTGGRTVAVEPDRQIVEAMSV